MSKNEIAVLLSRPLDYPTGGSHLLTQRKSNSTKVDQACQTLKRNLLSQFNEFINFEPHYGC